MDDYRPTEIERLLAAGPQPSEDFYRLQATGDGSTRWMNVSETELSAIGAVLSGARFVLTIDTGNAATRGRCRRAPTCVERCSAAR